MKIQRWIVSRSVVLAYLANGFVLVLGGAIGYGVYSAVSSQVEEFIQHALSNFPPLR